jgi:invasion protein IalB
MRRYRGLLFFLSLLIGATFAVAAAAQQSPAPQAAHPAAKRTIKPRAKPKAKAKIKPAVKPALIGRYGSWGVYTATPGGKKICFAIAKPTTAVTNPPHRLRDQPYMFLTTRPADKVTNEVSIAFGYPLNPSAQASIQVGQISYALYTEGDGGWIKNAAQQAQVVNAMRTAVTAVVDGVSTRGTKTTDTYALTGLAQALDRVAQACP